MKKIYCKDCKFLVDEIIQIENCGSYTKKMCLKANTLEMDNWYESILHRETPMEKNYNNYCRDYKKK